MKAELKNSTALLKYSKTPFKKNIGQVGERLLELDLKTKTLKI